jgi:hypothetical protein
VRLNFTNKLSGAVVEETVAELTSNLAYPCIILFYLFIPPLFSFLFHF